MKRLCKVLMAICVICMAFAVTMQVNAAGKKVNGELPKTYNGKTEEKIPDAGVSAFPAGSVDVNYFSPSEGDSQYRVEKISGAAGVQVQLLSYTKEPLASNKGFFNGRTYGHITLSRGVKTQRYFYYKARAIYYKNGSYTYGGWSTLKVFSTLKPTLSGSNYKITVKTPKLSGISKYEIWTSAKSSDTGFKKAATITAGNSIVLGSINGKSIRSYGNYHDFYVYIRPLLSNGKVAKYTVLSKGIYFYPSYN